MYFYGIREGICAGLRGKRGGRRREKGDEEEL